MTDKHTKGDWNTGRPDMFSVHFRGKSRITMRGKSIYVDDPRGGFHHLTGDKLPLEIGTAYGKYR